MLGYWRKGRPGQKNAGSVPAIQTFETTNFRLVYIPIQQQLH